MVTHSESESTTSNHLRDPQKRCRGLNKAGVRCNAYRVTGGDLCLFHDLDAQVQANVAEARRRGGSAAHHQPRNAFDFSELPIDLHDANSLLAFAEGMIRMQLAGAIPLRQCAQILRTLRVVERALSASAAPLPVEHIKSVSGFIEAADSVAESLEIRESAERIHEIQDVGSKRQEYLKANQQFEHNRPQRAFSPNHPAFRMPRFLG